MTDETIWGELVESLEAGEFAADCPRREPDGSCPAGCDACERFVREMSEPLQKTTEPQRTQRT